MTWAPAGMIVIDRGEQSGHNRAVGAEVEERSFQGRVKDAKDNGLQALRLGGSLHFAPTLTRKAKMSSRSLSLRVLSA